ncbi:hypothetical protein RvY_17657 [Ramazzottius varieornatus]|uniref:Uncharacterized protein n=1 Tax=Ramazzottius varieornatus TaxID=947166 RepID=A0A1D1W2X4_RAMVA|nr:hypothetical protein RvY_17657 [Ramazzottius varieornatus]
MSPRPSTVCTLSSFTNLVTEYHPAVPRSNDTRTDHQTEHETERSSMAYSSSTHSNRRPKPKAKAIKNGHNIKPATPDSAAEAAAASNLV